MWRRKWQPSPVFLPGESHAQRSLMGYSPWGRKELDTTELLTHTHRKEEQTNSVIKKERKEENGRGGGKQTKKERRERGEEERKIWI